MRIALTGSSGKLGSVVARELRAEGHRVIGLDVVGTRAADFVQVDLTDYGQVVDALTAVGDTHDGFDAVVHLAAVPAPGIRSDVATFHNNMTSTFNVFWAAIRLGNHPHRLRIERDCAGSAVRRSAAVCAGR